MKKWQKDMIAAMKVLQDSCQYTTIKNEYETCHNCPFVDWCIAIEESEGIKSIKDLNIPNIEG